MLKQMEVSGASRSERHNVTEKWNNLQPRARLTWCLFLNSCFQHPKHFFGSPFSAASFCVLLSHRDRQNLNPSLTPYPTLHLSATFITNWNRMGLFVSCCHDNQDRRFSPSAVSPRMEQLLPTLSTHLSARECSHTHTQRRDTHVLATVFTIIIKNDPFVYPTPPPHIMLT